MKKIYLIISIIILLIIGFLAYNKFNTQGFENFSFKEKSFDFGIIKQSGGIVKHDFEFTYNGEIPLKIEKLLASCACTKAEINKDELKKGDKGVITVIFNPNLHEEPDGKFFKTISIITNPKIENISELRIWAEINLDLGKDAYELKGGHND